MKTLSTAVRPLHRVQRECRNELLLSRRRWMGWSLLAKADRYKPAAISQAPHGLRCLTLRQRIFQRHGSGPTTQFVLTKIRSATNGSRMEFQSPAKPGRPLLINGATTNKIANYSVIASNAGGVTASAAATFSLLNTNPIPRLAAMTSSNSAQATFSLTGEVGVGTRSNPQPIYMTGPICPFFPGPSMGPGSSKRMKRSCCRFPDSAPCITPGLA